MADSDITISGLVATPGIGHIALQYVVDDPHENGLLNLALKEVEIRASSTNDRNAGTVVAIGNRTNAFHPALLEGATWYYWSRAKNQQGYYGDWYPSSATAGVQGVVGSASGNALGGGKIVASAAANALTVSLKNLAGDTPTAARPVWVPFRNATGGFDVAQATAALNLVVPQGATMEVATIGAPAPPFRLWILALYNSGALDVGVIKTIDAARTVIYPLNESKLISTTAIGTGADVAGVVYSNSTLSNVPFRIIGFLEWSGGLASAGDWTWTPATDFVRLYGIGQPKPGDVIQPNRMANNFTIVSAATLIPYDNTLPQSGEGSEIAFWSLSIAATSRANVLDYSASISVSHRVAGYMIGALFYDSAVGAIAVDACKIPAVDDLGRLTLTGRFYPLDLLSHTYKIRVGASTAGTWTVNGINNAAWLGSVLSTIAEIKEVMT